MIETITGQPLPPGAGGPGASAPDPRQSEDCLYLDVKAPRAVFDEGRKGLPVLVWIHGGGFTAGSKNEVNPAGLIGQGLRDGKRGFVYVGINYRLYVCFQVPATYLTEFPMANPRTQGLVRLPTPRT